MKKLTNLVSKIAFVSLVAFTLTSCLGNDDGYSLGKFTVDIATIRSDKQSFVLDDGTTLFIAAPATPPLVSVNERVIINYTLLSDKYAGYDHAIKLNSISDILTKSVFYANPTNTHIQDSIGNEPIKVIALWEGGGYLNLRVRFDTNGKPHMLNLVSPDPTLMVTKDTVALELRHGLGKDKPGGYPAESYVSFRLKPYDVNPNDTVVFKIKVKKSNTESEDMQVKYVPRRIKN